MQALVIEANSHDRPPDPAALAAQIHAYHSAALIGASQTAARTGKLMRNTMPWPGG